MKKKYIYISIIGIIVFILFFTFDSKAQSIISEEASPIREEDKIVGFNYFITIGDKTNESNIMINTAILSSINHYKNIKSIDNFFIDLKIINNSKYSYSIKDIIIVDNNKEIKKLKYKKKNTNISFKLTKDDLINYNSNYYIKIRLER